MVLVFLFDRMKSSKELAKFVSEAEFTRVGSVKTSGHYLMFSPYDRADPHICRVSEFMEHVTDANHIEGELYDMTVAGLSRLDQVYDVPRIRDRQLIGLEGFTQAFAYITNKTGIEEAKHWNIQLKTFKIGTWTLPKHITV
jgi:hypothetical protein